MSTQQIITMLEMQDAMNRRVNAQWQSQGFKWYRAVWTECAELLDHYGWKWWKKQVPDWPQVRLEVVDIWHFGLSCLIMTHKPFNIIADEVMTGLDTVLDGFSRTREHRPFDEEIEGLANHALSFHSFSIPHFAGMLAGAEMTLDDLYRIYVSKNVLNFFRQDHGYQEGTYIKVWDGREDNEHLAEIADSLDATRPSYRDDLYAALEARYQELCQ